MQRAPPVGGGLDDRVDAEHQRADEQPRAEHVRTLREADAHVTIDEPHGQERGGDADRQVDEEDPVPVDRLGDHAAEEQPDRRSRGGDEAVDADRLRALARLREHRDDHPQDHGRGQRAADALDEARAHQNRLALGEPAERRGCDEDRQADHEDAPPADEIAQPAREEEEAAEGDQVGVDHPREARLAEPEVALDRRQGDVDDRLVEDDHQEADAEHDERDPARTLVGGRSWLAVSTAAISVMRGSSLSRSDQEHNVADDPLSRSS